MTNALFSLTPEVGGGWWWEEPTLGGDRHRHQAPRGERRCRGPCRRPSPDAAVGSTPSGFAIVRPGGASESDHGQSLWKSLQVRAHFVHPLAQWHPCLLYTSDAADEED